MFHYSPYVCTYAAPRLSPWDGYLESLEIFSYNPSFVHEGPIHGNGFRRAYLPKHNFNQTYSHEARITQLRAELAAAEEEEHIARSLTAPVNGGQHTPIPRSNGHRFVPRSPTRGHCDRFAHPQHRNSNYINASASDKATNASMTSSAEKPSCCYRASESSEPRNSSQVPEISDFQGLSQFLGRAVKDSSDPFQRVMTQFLGPEGAAAEQPVAGPSGTSSFTASASSEAPAEKPLSAAEREQKDIDEAIRLSLETESASAPSHLDGDENAKE
ncbi:hypothetical protein DL96DRAFT_1572302 [Flagelloscypha sp. PMI_526]|nr:hypothetical protein DL96DRAFT_1572302 [Flagelloscypha sp. PMI_526]